MKCNKILSRCVPSLRIVEYVITIIIKYWKHDVITIARESRNPDMNRYTQISYVFIMYNKLKQITCHVFDSSFTGSKKTFASLNILKIKKCMPNNRLSFVSFHWGFFNVISTIIKDQNVSNNIVRLGSWVTLYHCEKLIVFF